MGRRYMTVDIASLGIRIDSSDALTAARNLENMRGAGARAEQSAISMASAFRVLGSALATLKVIELAKDAAMLAARFETMGVVLGVAGNNAGYTRNQMAELEQQMTKTGISMIKSREVLTSMATANIDLANATKLARAAQDLAVVGNINSSEATARLIGGIKSGEVEVLRTLGLNVSFENSYKTLAIQLHTTTEKLSENQKMTARTNAALAEAARYNGIYEESLGTAGKAINSLSRYWEDLKVKAGDAFLPALSAGVFGLTDALKAANVELDKAGSDGTVIRIGQGLGNAFKTVYETVMVLGANVGFAFSMIAGEISTIATQAVALAHLDFKGAKEIGQAWVVESAAARKAVDAFSESIINGTKAVNSATEAGYKQAALTEQQRIVLGQYQREKQAADEKALKAAAELLAAQKSIIAARLEMIRQAAEVEKAIRSEALEAIIESNRQGIASDAQLQVARYNSAISSGEAIARSMQTEIDALKKFHGKDLNERVENQAKIDKLTAQKNEALRSSLVEANMLRTKYVYDSSKDQRDAQAASAEEIAAIYKQTESLKEQYKTYGMLPEAITAVTIAKLEAKAVNLEATGEALDYEIPAIMSQIAALKALAEQQKKTTELDRWVGIFKSIDQTAHDTFVSIFNGGKSAFDRLRDTLKSGLLDLLYQMTIKKWIFSIGASVTGTSGVASAAESAGSSALGSTAGSLLGVGGLTGSMAAGAGWLTGATTLGGSLSAAGSLFATGSMAGSLAGAGMIVGALAPIALGIGAAVAIWKKLDTSGTYHTGGASSASAAGVSTIRAESLNFQGTQVSAETEKMTATLASGIVGILDSTAAAFGKTAGYTAATAFADDTSKDGAWGGLVISKLGAKILDWQDTKTGSWAPKVFSDGAAGQTEYLAALSGSVRTALDGIGLPSWAGSMLDALGAAPTIEQLTATVNTIVATQSALATLGDRLVGFAGMSDAAASALMAASGGIDKLTANASVYYDKFYTDGEKAAAVTKQLTASLAAVGLALPKTDADFRALVETQMGLGEAGAKSVSVLLANAGAFADLTAAADKLAESTGSAAEKIASANAALLETLGAAADSSLAVLRKSVDAEKASASAAFATQSAILNAQKSAAQSSVEAATAATQKIGALANSLKSTLDGMRLSATASTDRVSAQGQIDRALSVAKLTGVLPDAEGIADALRTVAQPNQKLYASYADFASDYYITAGKIADLNALTGNQLTKAETTLSVAKSQLQTLDDTLNLAQKTYDEQVGYFDSMLTNAQSQLEIASGTNVAVMSLSAAMSTLGASITSLAAAKGTSAAVVDASASMGGDDPTTAMIKELYRTALGREGEADGIAWWRNVAAGGASASQIAAGFYGSPEYIKLHGAHANGGVASGWSLVGEEGPEVVNFTTPARVYTASQSRAMMGGSDNSELVAEVRALRADNANMRAELQAIAGHTAKTSRLIERAMPRGDAIATREVTA